MPLPAGLDESLTLRRVARRLGRRSPQPSAARPPLAQPVGLKLELTHRCNLRCGFCYTDSPRRTLEGTPDVSDDTWRRVVDEGLELGIIEAVVSGGEPLLRKDLALELCERLDAERVAVSLNTNGWFVDEAVADRIAALRDVRVHVSIDGASPQVHDTARGVPGSWRRAIRAIDLLLSRGVSLQAIHVVGPHNAPTVETCLEHLWRLGVDSIGVSTIAPVGAAARESGWAVDRRPVDQAVAAFRKRRGDVALALPRIVESLATREDRPPGSMLVRPDGTVMLDSLHPFSFGGVDDGLATCWTRMREGWRDPRIDAWSHGIGSVREMADAPVVAYRDEPVEIAGRRPAAAPGRPRRSGALLAPPAPVEPGDLGEAREHVTALALARRYRLGEVRAAGTPGAERYVRVLDGSATLRVNATAGLVMDACAAGTPDDALATLRKRHPSVPEQRLVDDVLRTVRWLVGKRVLRAAASR